LLGQLNKILEISDSEAGLKVEKSGGVFGEEGERLTRSNSDCKMVPEKRLVQVQETSGPGNVLSGKRLSGKVSVWETTAYRLELSPRVIANCRFHHNFSSPAEDSLFKHLPIMILDSLS